MFRDLKPENVAFDLRGDMRLFDFGLAKELKPSDLIEAPDGFNATGLIGSRRYMAPEVVLCKPYGFSADVFSFAIIVWEVLAGQMAFPKMSLEKHYEQVIFKDKRPKKLKKLPKSLDQLMERAWDSDRLKRPTFPSICETLSKQISALNCSSTRSHLSDRTAFLTNESFRSRCESNESLTELGGRQPSSSSMNSSATRS